MLHSPDAGLLSSTGAVVTAAVADDVQVAHHVTVVARQVKVPTLRRRQHWQLGQRDGYMCHRSRYVDTWPRSRSIHDRHRSRYAHERHRCQCVHM
jgi:hypothetical protein